MAQTTQTHIYNPFFLKRVSESPFFCTEDIYAMAWLLNRLIYSYEFEKF
jgi:hypothetical protein